MQWLAALSVRRPVFATCHHPVADGRRRLRFHAAGPRPLSQGRLPHRRRHDAAAGRRAGGSGDGDHRQDRGSGEHHQRIDELRSNSSEGVSQVIIVVPAREGRRHRRAGSPRPRQPGAAAAAEDHRAADGREVRPGRGAGAHPGGVGATSRSATSPSTPTRRSGASSKASTASARSWWSAAARGRSTSCSTPARLRAYNLTVTDVSRALQTQNAEMPGGRVEQGATAITLRTRGRVQSVAGFGDIVVRQQDGHADSPARRRHGRGRRWPTPRPRPTSTASRRCC